MKRAFFAVLFLQVNLCIGQNLVPNGTLEDANICTERQQPCSPSGWFYIRKGEVSGYFSPSVGNGYRYLMLLTANSENAIRTYWETMLLCPLVPGEKYTVRLRVASNGVGPNLHDIGFYFTDSLLFAGEDTLLRPDNYLQFADAKVEELPHYWFKLEKEFTVSEAHQYLIVGNFSRESNRKIIRERNFKEREMRMMIDDLEIIPENKAICAGAQHVKDSLYAIRERHSIGLSRDTVVVAKDSVVPVVVPAVRDSIVERLQERKIDTLRINNIQFEFNSYVLKNVAVLDSMSGFFVGKEIKRIQVVGYADNTGTDAYNKSLSEKRAKEISRLITARFGVSPALIESEGRGISNDYADKRLNRRVEVYVYH